MSYDPHARFFALHPPLPVPPPLPVYLGRVALSDPPLAPGEAEAAALSAIGARTYAERARKMGREPEVEPEPAKSGAVAWPDADDVYKRRAAAMAPKARPAA